MADRKTLNTVDNLTLYSEVNGICPLCTKELIYTKNGKREKLYEIAHIYPLNPLKKEFELLKNEEKLSTDVNSTDNLIALCKDCHKKFDNPITVEDYRKLVSLKKNLLKEAKVRKNYFKFPIEYEIKEIFDYLCNYDINDELKPLSYKVLKINQKADASLTTFTRRKIKNDVIEFFPFIKSLLKDIDLNGKTSSDIIAAQIKSFYLKLKSFNLSQEQTYHYIAEWLSKKSTSPVYTCEIVVSYYIQNCEVFS